MSTLLQPAARILAAQSVRQQRTSGLWDPSLWNGRVSDTGRLLVDDVDVADLVTEFGSPLMAVSIGQLQTDAIEFRNAVDANFRHAMVTYSYKTNCVPGALRELHSLGYGAEVISPFELWLAESLGIPGERIIVNGVNKTRDYAAHAARLGVASVNVDSIGELDLLADVARETSRTIRVSLRLRLDDTSHFGLSVRSNEAMRAAERVAASPDAFEFAGLHFHCLADNNDPQKHADQVVRALRFAESVQRYLGLRTRLLNIGGGYSVPTVKVMSRIEYGLQRLFRVPARPPDPAQHVCPDDYMRVVAEALHSFCDSRSLQVPGIVVEPGRAISSRSHILLTRVHSLKARASGYVAALTDAGRILTSFPCDYEYHQMFVANRMHEEPQSVYDLMGRLCTDADWLAKTRLLPSLKPDDILAVMDAGAYFTSYSSNFSFPRPAIVRLENGSASLIRNEQTFSQLVAAEILPVRLTDQNLE